MIWEERIAALGDFLPVIQTVVVHIRIERIHAIDDFHAVIDSVAIGIRFLRVCACAQNLVFVSAAVLVTVLIFTGGRGCALWRRFGRFGRFGGQPIERLHTRNIILPKKAVRLGIGWIH